MKPIKLKPIQYVTIAYYIGPLRLFGLPVFIQGILLIYYHFVFKSKLFT